MVLNTDSCEEPLTLKKLKSSTCVPPPLIINSVNVVVPVTLSPVRFNVDKLTVLPFVIERPAVVELKLRV